MGCLVQCCCVCLQPPGERAVLACLPRPPVVAQGAKPPRCLPCALCPEGSVAPLLCSVSSRHCGAPDPHSLSSLWVLRTALSLARWFM